MYNGKLNLHRTTNDFMIGNIINETVYIQLWLFGTLWEQMVDNFLTQIH